MIKGLLITWLTFFKILLYAQDPKQLLHHSYTKSQTINNGYYEMDKQMKFMDEKDTNSSNTFKFYFQKLRSDSIYPVAFHYKYFFNGQYVRNVLYTGEDYVTFSSKDSSGTVMSKKIRGRELMARRYGELFNFYAPFTGALYSPFPNKGEYGDSNILFKWIGNDSVNNFSAFHVQVIKYPPFDSTEIFHPFESIYDYWINKEDSVLIKYSASTKIAKGQDTLQEYFSWSVRKYKLNSLQPTEKEKLNLTSIPSYINLNDYTESEKIPLLPNEEPAPQWTLRSLENNSVSLADFKGKLVLLDFFYLSCYPCLQALPMLQKLHDKYKSKGLVVLGLNPFDEVTDGVENILKKRGVQYPVFLKTESVASDYLVSSYPTIYLVGKDGKIIYSHTGYQEGYEQVLEDLIKQHL
jgi:thiol-disulfide isomerase/thioredoxin